MEWISIFDQYPPNDTEIIAIANDGFIIMGEFHVVKYCKALPDDHENDGCNCCLRPGAEDFEDEEQFDCGHSENREEFFFKGWWMGETYNFQSVFPPIAYWVLVPERPSNYKADYR